MAAMGGPSDSFPRSLASASASSLRSTPMGYFHRCFFAPSECPTESNGFVVSFAAVQQGCVQKGEMGKKKDLGSCRHIKEKKQKQRGGEAYSTNQRQGVFVRPQGAPTRTPCQRGIQRTLRTCLLIVLPLPHLHPRASFLRTPPSPCDRVRRAGAPCPR
jgi:hypothetical protein